MAYHSTSSIPSAGSALQKHSNTYLNFSIHSIPFGSSVLCTKQLNASRNSSPQGPCAMPPRQGQSQLISPVSGLKAPSWPASASRSSIEPPGAALSSSPSVAGAAAALPSDSSDASDFGAAAAAASAAAAALAFALSSAARAAARARFSATTASMVGSSLCWIWWMLSSNLLMAAAQ